MGGRGFGLREEMPAHNMSALAFDTRGTQFAKKPLAGAHAHREADVHCVPMQLRELSARGIFGTSSGE